jgi:ABC-type transporter Mla subunit MlaD
MEPDGEVTTGTPRWVKVFGIIAIVVALLFVIMLAAGGGRHGPSRHALPEASR